MNLLKRLNSNDFIRLGIKNELIELKSLVVFLDKLTIIELVSILNQSRFCVLEQYLNYYKINSDKLIVEEVV